MHFEFTLVPLTRTPPCIVLVFITGEREVQESRQWNSNPKHGSKAIAKWHEKQQKMMRKWMEKQQQMDKKKTEAVRQIAELRARNLLLREQAKQAFFDQRLKSDAIFKDRLNQNHVILADQNLDFSNPPVKNHHQQPAALLNHMKMIKPIVMIGDHGQGHGVPEPGLTDGSINNFVHRRQHLHNSGTIALSDSVTYLPIETGFSTSPVHYSQTSMPTDIKSEFLASETTEVPTATAYPKDSVLVPAEPLAQPKEVILDGPISSHKPGFQTNTELMNDQSKQFNPNMNVIPLRLATPTNRVTTQQAPSLRELLTILNLPANIDPNFTNEIILKHSKIRDILTMALHNISRLLSPENSNTTPSVKFHNPSNAHGQKSGALIGIPREMVTESASNASTSVPIISRLLSPENSNTTPSVKLLNPSNVHGQKSGALIGIPREMVTESASNASTSVPIINSTTVHQLIPRHPQDQIKTQQQGQLLDLMHDRMSNVHGVPIPVPGESMAGNNINNTDNRNVGTDFPWEIHDGISGKVAVTPKNVQIIDILSSEGDSLIVNNITNEKSSSPPAVPERTTLSSPISTTDSNVAPLPQVFTTPPKLRRNTISIDIFANAIRDMLRRSPSKV